MPHPSSAPHSSSDSAIQRWTAADPDVGLMLKVRAGNAAAFEELVRRYQPRLLTILQHLTGASDLAEDLAQETFLRVFRARESYVPGARFSTWLFTIAHHVASNARRQRARRRERPASATAPQPADSSQSLATIEQLAQAASGQLPTRQADRREMAEIVRASLAVLNERQRMAVLLNKFEGLGYAEIATAMQLSVPAVKSLLTRARCQLREVLAPYVDHTIAPPIAAPSSPSPPTPPSADPEAADD